MADSCEESCGKSPRTLVVYMPGFADDLIILHCEVRSDDPLTAFGFIEVSGVLLSGHLGVDEVRAYVSKSGLPNLEDPEMG
jgi:hypothetical protein